jgi:hypothetical protein|tara:strand:+ start:707 stop:952 length:246 start_codon:yes stop_codon:yes gene_type:complete
MNKQIELVKKWLANKDSVTPEELKANKKEAYYITNRTYGSGAIQFPEYFPIYYADSASHFAAANDAVAATYWVTKYGELET